MLPSILIPTLIAVIPQALKGVDAAVEVYRGLKGQDGASEDTIGQAIAAIDAGMEVAGRLQEAVQRLRAQGVEVPGYAELETLCDEVEALPDRAVGQEV